MAITILAKYHGTTPDKKVKFVLFQKHI